MDPRACLQRAATALTDYGDWRRRGGFGPPVGGDEAARLLRKLVERLRRGQGATRRGGRRMKCDNCDGGEVILYGGEAICLDCTLFWPAADGPEGDELATAETGAAGRDDE